MLCQQFIRFAAISGVPFPHPLERGKDIIMAVLVSHWCNIRHHQ